MVPGASGKDHRPAAGRREAPDGDTLFFANASMFTSDMFMLKSIPYDPMWDFTAGRDGLQLGPGRGLGLSRAAG